MSHEIRNDLTALEANLARLAPAPACVDRDRLLYTAGRAAGSRPWKHAACGLAGLCVALTVFVLVRPPRTVTQTVTIPIPDPVEPAPSVSPPSAADSFILAE